METQILSFLSFFAAGAFYVVIRRNFEFARVEAGKPKSLRWIFGALAIAFIWISDELFACASKGCNPEFLSALKLEHLSFFVFVFYLHVLFASIEAYFFLVPKKQPGPAPE